MNEISPLPQPGGATCPNCGAAQNAGAPYCTNCGAEMRVPTPSSLSKSSATILTIVLALGALMFGAIGGCFVLVSRVGGGGGFNLTLALFIGVPLLAALACIWGIFRVQSKK